MIKIHDIANAIDALAPQYLAEVWDNCGLLVGDPEMEVDSVVLSLDADRRAANLADEVGAQLIITHHPILFEPVNRINYSNPEQRMLLQLIHEKRAIFAAHTNLDNAVGGVNDALLAKLGYRSTSTLVPVEEAKPRADIALVNAVDKAVMPGAVRVAALPEPVNRRRLAAHINNQLQTAGCFLNYDTDAPVQKLAVSGGSFDGDWIDLLEEQGVDFLLSGEIKHHHMLALELRGISAMAAGHDATERIVLPPLANYLSETFPSVRFAVNMGLNYNNLVF